MTAIDIYKSDQWHDFLDRLNCLHDYRSRALLIGVYLERSEQKSRK